MHRHRLAWPNTSPITYLDCICTKQPSSCNKLGVLQDVEPICITWIFVVWWEKNYSITTYKFEKLQWYSIRLVKQAVLTGYNCS